MPTVPAPGATGVTAAPRPAGDSDVLRSIRDALIGPVTGLLTFASNVDALASVAGWQGPAADAFGGRMHAIANRMRSASRTLGDGQQALDALANSLQDADESWDLAQALTGQGVPAGGLFAGAAEMSSSAYRLARQRLDDATHRLAPLTLDSRAPQPKPMTLPVNPCGLVPEEAAGAFWNQGMVPINTECLAVVEVTIDMDGIPVETFEAVPIGREAEESKPKKAGRDEPIQSVQEKVRIRARIDRQLAAGTADEKFEAGVAKHVLAEGFPILKFRSLFVTSEGEGGEIDFETNEAIVEVTRSPNGKVSQTRKYQDPLVNPTHKAVIVFSPTYANQAAADLAEQGVFVVRDMNQLINLLHELRG
ncbi:MAG TPA: WXG100 family type VII secretion target [Actinomycetota bacterium]|nr:WXG100 family type VII secretion target [Actinomycetota bacterium]